MPKLYLVPNSISESDFTLLPAYIAQEIQHLRIFFVEETKSARRLLKHLGIPLNECQFHDLNEHSSLKQIEAYAQIARKEDTAIISEAGCPCVADPGSNLVFLAHQYQIDIHPLVGPSSILLALMASGLSGQSFAFNGYLPKDKAERIKKISLLEDRSHREKQTQIFMEAPYRNQALLEDVLAICKEKTHLCIASAIGSPHQYIKTMCIQNWKKNLPAIDKQPTLFLIYSP